MREYLSNRANIHVKEGTEGQIWRRLIRIIVHITIGIFENFSVPATVMFVTVTVVAFVVVDYDIACFFLLLLLLFFFLALSGTLVKLYLIKIQWEFMLSSESIFLVKFQSGYRWMANYKQNG